MAEEIKKNKVYVNTYQGPFQNSDFLVVEYDDVIQAPELIFLHMLTSSKTDLSELFDMEYIYSFTKFTELIEWYIFRPNKELFTNIQPTEKCLDIAKTMFPSNDISESFTNFSEFFVEKTMDSSEIIDDILENSSLNFFKTFKIMMNSSTVKSKIVFSKYSPEFCKVISNKLTRLCGSDVTVQSCTDLSSLLKDEKVTNNSTFVFSNINHVNDVKETNLLEKSSIVLSEPYGYNYKDSKYKVDIEALFKDNIFKFNCFDNYN